MIKIEKGFKNERLGLELDVYVKDGREWFLGNDVAKFFGYAQAKDMIRISSFPETHTCRHNVPRSNGYEYEMIFIDEFLLYEICCKISRADKERFEKAKIFQEWVFGEVLPLIRQNGAVVDVTKDDTPESIEAKIEAGAEEARRRYEQYQEEELESASSEIDNLNARNTYLECRVSHLENEESRLRKILRYFLERDKSDFLKRNDVSMPEDPVKYKKFLSKMTANLVPRDPIYAVVRVPDYFNSEEEFYA